MKKLTGIILALTFVATLGTSSVFAASTEQRGGGIGRNTSDATCQFVDENKDGICDIHGTDCQFIDEDKDGICDNYPNGGIRPRNGMGRGAGQGKFGGGRFADNNGDGVCDNYGSGACGRI